MSWDFFVSTHAEGRVAPIAIDCIGDDGLSLINRESLQQIALRYPNVVVMSSDELQARQESCLCSDPVPIEADRFIEMLEVLPPMKWNNAGHTESFMISEFTSGRITGIYCRIGKTYFSFLGICSLTHNEIVQKCMPARDAFNAKEVARG